MMYNVKVTTTGRVIYGVDSPVTLQTVSVDNEHPLAALRIAIKAFKSWEDIPATYEQEHEMWLRLGQQIEKLDDLWCTFGEAAHRGLEQAGFDLVTAFQAMQTTNDAPSITIEYTVDNSRTRGTIIGQ